MQPYRRITLAVGVSMFVDASLYLAVLPLLPHYADRFGLSTIQAALVLAAYPISVPFVSLGCIVLVPKVGARRITLFSAALMTVATVIFAWAPTVEVLIVARFVQGFASGSIWTASMSWVTDNAPADRRGRESGIVMGFLSAGSVAGPAIGALAASAGSELAFGLVAGVSALGVVLAWFAPAGRLVVADPHLFESIRRGARQRATIAAMSVNLIDLLAFSSVDLLVPLQLGAMGTPVSTIAIAFAAGAAMGAIAGPIGGRLVDRSGPARVGLVTGVFIMLTPFLLALGPSEAVQLGLLVAGGVLFSVMGASMFPLSSLGADQAGVPHVTVMGLMGAIWAAGSSIMPLLLGAVAQATSNSVAFALAGLLCLTVVLILARSVRSVNALPVADSL